MTTKRELRIRIAKEVLDINNEDFGLIFKKRFCTLAFLVKDADITKMKDKKLEHDGLYYSLV